MNNYSNQYLLLRPLEEFTLLKDAKILNYLVVVFVAMIMVPREWVEWVEWSVWGLLYGWESLLWLNSLYTDGIRRRLQVTIENIILTPHINLTEIKNFPVGHHQHQHPTIHFCPRNFSFQKCSRNGKTSPKRNLFLLSKKQWTFTKIHSPGIDQLRLPDLI